MNQLGLPISFKTKASLENFIANKQVKNLINDSLCGDKNLKLYVYGENGIGKTHLLKACFLRAIELKAQSFFIDCKDGIDEYILDIVKNLQWLIIDNIHLLKPLQEEMLFDIYNIAVQENVNIISSGNLPPKSLNIIKDIKTRLSIANVFALEALSDEQIAKVLNLKMIEKNIAVDVKVYQYLFKHYSRDIKNLIKALESLDKASIESKQNISIFLAKKVLNI